MNKKGNIEPMLYVLLAILLGGGLLIYANNQGWLGSVSGGGGATVQDWASTCGDDLQSTVTLDLFNSANLTGAEQFDAQYYLIGAAGDFESGTDTTAGSETLNCGEKYTLYLTYADGDEGNNTFIEKIMVGPGASIVDGNIVFTPNKDQYSLRFGASQHGVLEFKSYDRSAAGWMCNSDDSCTDYETDGVSFTSTTNGTALAIGAGGFMDISLDVRSTKTDTVFGDDYWLILVEAPVATWNAPVVKVNGVRQSDVKGSLTSHEEKAFSAYEYIYKVSNVPIEYAGVDIDFYMSALAGVDPSTDPEIDFAAAGNFLSIDGSTIKNGAARDDSSATAVFTVQDVTIDIS